MGLLGSLITFVFLTSFKNIYPKELELEVELQGNHTSFLDLEIKIADSVFLYKFLDKRDKVPFSIVRMPHLSSNIPPTIFYWSIFSELLRIARCPLRINVFLPRAADWLSRMIAQGGNRAALTKQLRRVIHRYPTVFQNLVKLMRK